MKRFLLTVLILSGIGNATEFKPVFLSGAKDLTQWYRTKLGIDRVWEQGYTGKGVVVAVMSTGVDLTTPQLKGIWRGIEAWDDEIGGNSEPVDYGWKGTAIAGIIAGKELLGIAPDAKLVFIAVDSAGKIDISRVHSGFTWLNNLPDSLLPNIVVIPFGIPDYDNTEFWDDCKTLADRGVIVIAMAGNIPQTDSQYIPGTYPMVISVGASDESDEVAVWSARGGSPSIYPWNDTSNWFVKDWNYTNPDFVAPGIDIVSVYPGGGFIRFSGTEASAGVLAGVIALALSKNPELTPEEVYKYLRNTALLEGAIPNDTIGFGRIDALRLVSALPGPDRGVIVIDTILINDSGGDQNGYLDPGESAELIIRIKNIGKEMANIEGVLSYVSTSELTLSTNSANIPFLGEGDTASLIYNVSLASTFPETSFIYFTLKLTDLAGDTFYRFFNIFVPCQYHTGGNYVLINDDGGPAYVYFAGFTANQFTTISEDTIYSVDLLLYDYNGTGNGLCTLYVWLDSADIPGKVVYTQAFYATHTYPYLATVNLTSPVVVHGKYWVGVRTRDNPSNPFGDPDYQMISDNGMNKLSKLRYSNSSQWSYASGDFFIRPHVGRAPVYRPFINKVIAYQIDDRDGGNGDGFLDPSEVGRLYVVLENPGLPVKEAWAKLIPIENSVGRIKVIQDSVEFTELYDRERNLINLEPFIVRFRDVSIPDTLNGLPLMFRLVINSVYSGGSRTDTLEFSIPHHEVPQPYLWRSYPTGSGNLYVFNDTSWHYYFATFFRFGIEERDSIFVDSLYVYAYNTDGYNAYDLEIYIWSNLSGENRPDKVLFADTIKIGASTSRWIGVKVGKKLPGYFWYGQNSNIDYSGKGLHPIWWGDAALGYDYTLVSTSWNNWSVPIGIVNYPLSGYMKLKHEHIFVSYYTPSGWQYPVGLSSFAGNPGDTGVINGDTTVYVSGFVILNRTDSVARIMAGDTLISYMFIDNRIVAISKIPGPDSIMPWSYTYIQDIPMELPSGRHTFLTVIDWNDLFGRNVFSNMFRYWGNQFTLRPFVKLSAGIVYRSSGMAPVIYGVMGGSYPQMDIYRMRVRSSQWYAVAIKPVSGNDSVDLDLYLMEDEPVSNTTGFERILTISPSGGDTTDFILIPGMRVDTSQNFWLGVNAFTPKSDSYYIEYAAPYWIFSYDPNGSYLEIEMGSEELIHVEQMHVSPATPTVQLTVENESSDKDIALYVFGLRHGPIMRGNYRNCYEFYTMSDTSGPGGNEEVIFTPEAWDSLAIVIINKNPDNSKVKFKLRIPRVNNPISVAERRFNEFPALSLPTFVNSPIMPVVYSGISGRLELEIYDIAGRRIKRIDVKKVKGSGKIWVKGLRPGKYIIVASSGKYVVKRKFIVIY